MFPYKSELLRRADQNFTLQCIFTFIHVLPIYLAVHKTGLYESINYTTF